MSLFQTYLQHYVMGPDMGLFLEINSFYSTKLLTACTFNTLLYCLVLSSFLSLECTIPRMNKLAALTMVLLFATETANNLLLIHILPTHKLASLIVKLYLPLLAFILTLPIYLLKRNKHIPFKEIQASIMIACSQNIFTEILCVSILTHTSIQFRLSDVLSSGIALLFTEILFGRQRKQERNILIAIISAILVSMIMRLDLYSAHESTFSIYILLAEILILAFRFVLSHIMFISGDLVNLLVSSSAFSAVLMSFNYFYGRTSEYLTITEAFKAFNFKLGMLLILSLLHFFVSAFSHRVLKLDSIYGIKAFSMVLQLIFTIIFQKQDI